MRAVTPGAPEGCSSTRTRLPTGGYPMVNQAWATSSRRCAIEGASMTGTLPRPGSQGHPRPSRLWTVGRDHRLWTTRQGLAVSG